jgi:hypothetical protein
MIVCLLLLFLFITSCLCQDETTVVFSDAADTTTPLTTTTIYDSNAGPAPYTGTYVPEPTARTQRSYYFDNSYYDDGYDYWHHACPTRKRNVLYCGGGDYDRQDAGYIAMVCASVLLPVICLLGACFAVAAWLNGNSRGNANAGARAAVVGTAVRFIEK